MSADLPVPLLALLHEGGWDEVLMVAVGLVVAYGIIMWTGRRSRQDDEDDGEDLADDESGESAPLSAGQSDAPHDR